MHMYEYPPQWDEPDEDTIRDHLEKEVLAIGKTYESAVEDMIRAVYQTGNVVDLANALDVLAEFYNVKTPEGAAEDICRIMSKASA